MANSYTTNPVVLDTFTSIVDLCTAMGLASNTPLSIEWIKWETPTTAGDTCAVLDGSGGNSIFSETCATGKVSIVNYFNGQYVKNIYTAASGGASTGKILVLLRKNAKQ
jgi:hypothetical protein